MQTSDVFLVIHVSEQIGAVDAGLSCDGVDVVRASPAALHPAVHLLGRSLNASGQLSLASADLDSTVYGLHKAI